jgi:hypothetical protein
MKSLGEEAVSNLARCLMIDDVLLLRSMFEAVQVVLPALFSGPNFSGSKLGLAKTAFRHAPPDASSQS